MSFPRYPKCKDSGVEWPRSFPLHWSVESLKRVARLNYGNALASDERDENGDVPVFGSNGPVGIHDVANTGAPAILIGRKGSCGAINWSSRAAFAIDTVYFTDNRYAQCDLRWLFWLLQTLDFESASQDTGVPGLSREFVYDSRIVVPLSEEQTAIAAFLDRETGKIDALVAEQEKLIALLKEKRKAVISHAVTKGLNPDAPMKPSGIEWLGDVPAHWEIRSIKSIATEQHTLFIDGDWIESRNLSDEGIRYITTGNVGAGVYKEQGSGFISQGTFIALNCTEVLPGDVLISRLNPPIGRACVVPKMATRIVTSVDNVIVRPNAGFDRTFLVYRLTGSDYLHEAANLASGATMQRISRRELGSIRLTLPPYPEQIGIARYLTAAIEKLDVLSIKVARAVTLLKERRSALISAAVIGKIDVRKAI